MKRTGAISIGGAMFMLAGLASCGGGSSNSGGTPTPSPTPTATSTPTPTPSPTSTPFTVVAAQLYSDALYNSALATRGNAWLTPYLPNSPGPLTNVSQADDLSVEVDSNTGGYQANANVAGSGTIFQVGPKDSEGSYPAVVAPDAASAIGANSELLVTPGASGAGTRYIAIVLPFAISPPAPNGTLLFYYGAFGVAQPTKAPEIPATGIQRYTGSLYGTFDQDAGATFLTATATIDFDFSGAATTGSFVAKFACMMGCSYPDVAYTLNNSSKTGDNSFAGDIMTAGTSTKGRYTALLAGPAASEMLLAVEFPYYNPDYKMWMTFGGIFAAKKS